MKDSYPVSHTRDGVDTSKHEGGAMRNFLKDKSEYTSHQDSKTGERVAPPDYARDDD